MAILGTSTIDSISISTADGIQMNGHLIYANGTQAAQLVNYTSTNIGTPTTSYTWYLSYAYGAANNKYSLAHTATSLAVTINPLICENYQYFMLRQSTNTCTVTLTTISGYTVVTKGNVTSFTVAAGQTIEFCAIVVETYIYVTYTIFG